MVERHAVTHCFDYLGVLSFVVQRNRVQIVGFLQVAHGAEWNINHAIHVVVTVRDHVLEHADDLVGNAVNAHRLADRILAGKKFLLHIVAEQRHPAMAEIFLLAKEAAFSHIHVANLLIARVRPANIEAGVARPVGDHALLVHLW